MEISSTREAISAESAHETKTTETVQQRIAITSDKANLLDIIESDGVGRLDRYFLAESAAEV